MDGGDTLERLKAFTYVRQLLLFPETIKLQFVLTPFYSWPGKFFASDLLKQDILESHMKGGEGVSGEFKTLLNLLILLVHPSLSAL